MTKNLKWLIVLGVVALLALWCFSGYNSMVNAEENVESAWSQVGNEYQRRMDVTQQLVGAVKGAAIHEQSTLQAVIDARSKATQMTLDPTNATPEQLKAWQDAQGDLSQAMGRLMAVVESYPELKANENFLKLQSSLEANENKCAIARNTYNKEANEFNKLVRRFPSSIIANLMGFDKKPYFEAEANAKEAPTVDFSDLKQ